MPLLSGSFTTTNLAEILRQLVNAKQTGYLNIRYHDIEGFLAVENGVILNAKTGPYTAMHALFQFVTWREADFDFQEKAIERGLERDLAVYDPQVLISGVATKVGELAAI
jgi:hypothetical protein